MKKEEMLEKIIAELESLSEEKSRDFFYGIDRYADDYDEDSLESLKHGWESESGLLFENFFPKTNKLIEDIETLWDGVERDEEVYVDVIERANDAIGEIREYLKEESEEEE